MNYETAETEIAGRLNGVSTLTDIADAIVLPDDVEEYKTPTVKGLVTVVFMGEKFDANQSVGQVSQHSTVTFNVAVQARKMRGSRGVYVISEMVKAALVGFSPSDCGVLSLSEHDYAGYQNDVWEHSITFSCRSLRTQNDANYLPDNQVIDEEVYYTPGGLTIDSNIDAMVSAFSKGFSSGFQA